MNQDLTKKLQIGLTSEEVRSLTEQGLVNGDLNVKTKTYKQIIKDNEEYYEVVKDDKLFLEIIVLCNENM